MDTRRNASTRQRLIGVTALAVLGGLLIIATPVAAANPPGNNGTIKIDGMEWDTHPNNEPHPGCIFQLDFYGFDEGDLWADVTFEAHPPTGSGVLLQDRVFIGEDDNSGGGSTRGLDAEAGTETDADGAAYYDLSAALAAFEPHAQQGYHVKVTIHADGSQGADTKHKVFWVEPCATEETPPTTGGGGELPGTGENPGTGGELPGTGENPTTGGAPAPEDTVTTGGDVKGGRGIRRTETGTGGALPDTAVPATDSVGYGLLSLGVAVAIGGAATMTAVRSTSERER